MGRIEVERVFDASPEDVWAVYTDHAGWSRWAGLGPSRLERPGDEEPNGVGAIRLLGPGIGAAREEVVAFEPPKLMIYRLIGGPLPLRNHEGQVRFEPEGSGTRVVWRCRFDAPPGTGWLLDRAIEGVFRRALAGLARQSFAGGGTHA
ncbi:MAG: SRPBCC family protein [Myxococcota bacterium]|nr:SRPBCC family protein [Myxococcota bacterium]